MKTGQLLKMINCERDTEQQSLILKKKRVKKKPKKHFYVVRFWCTFLLVVPGVSRLWNYVFVCFFSGDCQALIATPAYNNKTVSFLSASYRPALINAPFACMKMRPLTRHLEREHGNHINMHQLWHEFYSSLIADLKYYVRLYKY